MKSVVLKSAYPATLGKASTCLGKLIVSGLSHITSDSVY